MDETSYEIPAGEEEKAGGDGGGDTRDPSGGEAADAFISAPAPRSKMANPFACSAAAVLYARHSQGQTPCRRWDNGLRCQIWPPVTIN
jgi:hypothetical protein